MSFNTELRTALSRYQPAKKCCRIAQLSAILRVAGDIKWVDGEPVALALSSPSSAVARSAHELIKEIFGVPTHIVGPPARASLAPLAPLAPALDPGQIRARRTDIKGGHSRRAGHYSIKVSAAAAPLAQMLDELGLLSTDTAPIRQRLIKNGCCRISYMRGAYLAGGSMSDPGRSSYHVEFNCPDEAWCHAAAGLLAEHGIHGTVGIRRGRALLYLKGSSGISDLLALIGSHSTLMRLEEVLVRRQITNEMNRLVNCDSANAAKTVAASSEQADAIRVLEETVGLESLSPALREMATVRMENPELSLSELGELCEPQLSKSAVAHRLRRLVALSRQSSET